MRALFSTLLARLRQFARPATGDADFDEELRTHLALAEEEKVHRGMSAEEARRQARMDLGGVAQLREAARAARGLPWLDTFLLDGKLGLRMLRRSWALTLVGGLAMAITIGLGASIFTIWQTFAGTRLPLDEGDRVVAIQAFDRASQRVQMTASIADFRRWRETLTSIEHVSAMRALDTEVITSEGAVGPLRAAEMTASAFRVARVQPLLGRPLTAEDDRPGAEPVAVIGYDLWQSVFSSDAAVLGQRIRIADTPHTIVGVMPEGFRFPMNQRLWIPLRIASADGERPEGGVFVFGRLARGATLARAHREFGTLGLLQGDVGQQTPAQLELRAVPYAAGFFPDVHANSWARGLIFLIAALLLVPPCANIAILVYARTVTRRDEFTARTALGASRGRIVMQLFVEVLVLAAGAGIAGFLLARQFSGQLSRIVVPTMRPLDLPFWMDFEPSLPTVVCVAALTVLAAAIAGGLPAWHATGHWRRVGALAWDGRGSGARLGRTWITLLAMQVALTLAILPSASEMVWGIFRPAIVGPGLPVEEFLTASLLIEGDRSRFEGLRTEAVGRLRADPSARGVTVSSTVPLEERFADIEVEGGETSGIQARFNSVDDRFFEVFDARMLAGRGFEAGDFWPASTSVIVNRSFVTEILGVPSSQGSGGAGGNGLGGRIRYRETDALVRARRAGGYVPPPGTHVIVGVVEDFPGNNDGPMMFHPLRAQAHPVTVTIRAASGTGVVAARLRAVAAGLDSRLRLGALRSLDDVYWQRRSTEQTFGLVLAAVIIIVFLFSMAGLYTLMTFIVVQRWREIGVRLALGAQPRQLLGGIFGRALVPLALGAIIGGAVALRLHSWLPIVEAGGQRIAGIIPLSAALVIGIGLFAVAGPARRAIRVDPTEALRVG